MTQQAPTMAEASPASTPEQTPPATPPSQAPPRRRPTWLWWLPWVVAVLAIAAAVYSTLQWRALATQQAQADSARAAAIGFVEDLTNWDAADGLDDEIEVLRQQGTGPFLDEIDFVFGGDDLTSDLQAAEISATGDLQEVFVQSLEGDLAEVFAVVSVTYSSPGATTTPTPVTFPASLTLQREDGGWLIREVSVPNSSQIGALMDPPDRNDGEE